MVMDRSERIVSEYLSYRGFRDVVHEPDGNVPADFLLNGCIAVEVRRLNQNEDTPDGPRGLEEAAIPLQAKVSRLLRTLGSSEGGESWYMVYTFRRPLPPWDELANALRFELGLFRCDSEHQPTTRNIAQGFRVRLLRAGRPYPDFFVVGEYTEGDSGGFVLSELERNIRICVAEKTQKISRVRERYPHWWLVLVDHVAYELSDSDREQLRQLLQMDHSCDKIILVSSLDATQGYEL
jgi:hypothetical protein